MRTPYQILSMPYKKIEKPIDAAIREVFEETGIKTDNIISLVSKSYIPANVISEKHRKYWGKDL